MSAYVAMIQMVVIGAAVLLLICRMSVMSHTTRRSVRNQHAALCSFMLASLVVPQDWAATMISVGVVAYLMMSKRRWKNGAPVGTVHPSWLSLADGAKVYGGRRHDDRD